MKIHFSISCVIMLLLVSCNDYWNSVCGGDYIVQLSNNTDITDSIMLIPKLSEFLTHMAREWRKMTDVWFPTL